MKRLLSEPGDSMQEIVHFHDDGKGTVTVETREDCTALVEHAKAMRDEPVGKDMKLAAYIPEYVMDQAFKEGWANDMKAWKKWLNDPDNAAFRVWPGRM